MQTQILTPNKVNIKKASIILKNGGLVSFPTETVYGLGANALDKNAILKIFEVKGRPSNNPLIVHISKLEILYTLCEVNDGAIALIKKFWPGPLTLVLPKKAIIPKELNGGLDSVAVRMPRNETALSLLNECDFPIAAPSANSSGKPSPTKAMHVYDDLVGRIPLIIDGGNCSVGLESTVIDLTKKPFTILRPGGVTLEQIKEVFPDTILSSAILEPLKEGEKALSPGMLYKHYSPNADLTLVEGDYDDVITVCNALAKAAELSNIKTRILCFEEHLDYYPKEIAVSFGKLANLENAAKQMFSILRDMDNENVEKIYSEIPAKGGLGLAILNRMIRAAGFKKINASEYLKKQKGEI